MPQSAGSDTQMTHKLLEVAHNMACAQRFWLAPSVDAATYEAAAYDEAHSFLLCAFFANCRNLADYV
eukprot:14234237-Heterocapsa_arctica.AAC.1